MAKYDIYKNKRNWYHPSIEIATNNNGDWFNYEITDSPKKGETYQRLNFNPNQNVRSDTPSFIRKYLRKDKLRHRGELLKHYVLTDEDKALIDYLLIERKENLKKNKKKNGVKRLNHISGNQASQRNRVVTPSVGIKTHRKRKHNRKERKTK